MVAKLSGHAYCVVFEEYGMDVRHL